MCYTSSGRIQRHGSKKRTGEEFTNRCKSIKESHLEAFIETEVPELSSNWRFMMEIHDLR
jgi:hypothetical protein